MPTVRAGSATLHYERQGAGEPLLWITGFAISAEIFSPVIETYARDYECLRYDNRGAGRSSSSWRPTSIPQLAGDAVRLMDALGVESAHVYGLSMGGMVAQELAIRFPDRVRALVLGGTTPGGPRGVLPSPSVATALAGQRAAPQGLRAEVIGNLLFTPEFRRREPDLVRSHLGLLSAHRAKGRGVLGHWWASVYHDTFSRLGRIAAPTLVLHGERDILTPVGNAHLLASRIPDAELAVVPGVGHGYLLEDPDTSHRLFDDFLRRRSPVPAGPPLGVLGRRAEPVSRALGLQVGAVRAGRSLLGLAGDRISARPGPVSPASGRSPGRRGG